MSAVSPLEHRAASDDAVIFFEHARETFEQALRRTTSRELDLRIAGYHIRLRFAGDALVADTIRALQHHVFSPGALDVPDLTICLWDGASTGDALPTLPFDPAQVQRRGEVAAYQNEHIRMTFNQGADILSLLDLERNLALCCTRDARRVPAYEAAAPLKTILYWWMRTRDVFFVHAGAVGTENGGVLLAGKGGSGKSTSALACLAANMRYVSDDYCLVRVHPTPQALNLYNSGKLTLNSLQLLPSLSELAERSETSVVDKKILFLDHSHGTQLAASLPIKAILLPRVTRRAEPRLTPTTANAALSALAISTLVQLPNAGDETLRALESLTNQMPCYVLELGEAQRVPQLLQEFLR